MSLSCIQLCDIVGVFLSIVKLMCFANTSCPYLIKNYKADVVSSQDLSTDLSGRDVWSFENWGKTSRHTFSYLFKIHIKVWNSIVSKEKPFHKVNHPLE